MGSTSENYRHHADEPITKANIRRVQEERRREGKKPWGPSGVVEQLVSCPTPRHIKRACKLMGV